MENFITEQGEIIVSGVVSVASLIIIYGVMKVISNVEICFLSSIMGV